MDILTIIKGGFAIFYFFFIPGFLLSLCVFRKRDIEWLERIGISIGLSMGIVPLFIFTSSIIGIRISEINAFLETTVLNAAFMIWLLYLYKKGRKTFL